MDDDKTRCCGNCALCVHTYVGGECSLTDNSVDYAQDGCIDYIPEDDSQENVDSIQEN